MFIFGQVLSLPPPKYLKLNLPEPQFILFYYKDSYDKSIKFEGSPRVKWESLYQVGNIVVPGTSNICSFKGKKGKKEKRERKAMFRPVCPWPSSGKQVGIFAPQPPREKSRERKMRPGEPKLFPSLPRALWLFAWFPPRNLLVQRTVFWTFHKRYAS